MLARKLFSLSSAQLPDPKTPASKSPVSITSKLIQTKALQVLYSGHLRKTGGRGSYRLVHAAYSLRAEASPVLNPKLAKLQPAASTRRVPGGNSPSPLFFVSDRNKGLEVLSFVSVLK